MTTVKMNSQILTRTIFAGALMMFAATQLALADGPTAFRLVKLGNEIIRARRELVPKFSRSPGSRIAASPMMPRNCVSNISPA